MITLMLRKAIVLMYYETSCEKLVSEEGCCEEV